MGDDLQQKLAFVIRALRRRNGWTQDELAMRANMHQPAIARLEAGGENPTVSTLSRIAETLGCELKITFAERAEVAVAGSHIEARNE